MLLTESNPAVKKQLSYAGLKQKSDISRFNGLMLYTAMQSIPCPSNRKTLLSVLYSPPATYGGMNIGTIFWEGGRGFWLEGREKHTLINDQDD